MNLLVIWRGHQLAWDLS